MRTKPNKNEIIENLLAKVGAIECKIAVMEDKKKKLENEIDKHRLEMFKENWEKYETLMKAAEDAGLDYDGVLQLFFNNTDLSGEIIESPHGEDKTKTNSKSPHREDGKNNDGELE